MPLQATSGAASYDAFGGGVPVVPNYIEEVFSTWLYTGNGSTQTITNGIDLAGKGGLVWSKDRGFAVGHVWYDTARGPYPTASYINSASTEAASLSNGGSFANITSFNPSGYTIGSTSSTNVINFSGSSYVSWTFREQAKFFDVVTWTGNGANRTIAHNLGSVPGCIIVKRTDTTSDWQVYHRSLANTQYMVLNTTAAVATGATRWNSTTPTSTVFSLGTDATVNASGGTYVAYIYAHDAGGFGLTGTDNVISCGSFTTDGSGNFTVNLGYEPQWILVKGSSLTTNWFMFDNMRGMPVGGSEAQLQANLANAEVSNTNFLDINATGFGDTLGAFGASRTFIYIAIRRGPMKVPTTGTSVFQPALRTGTGATATVTGINFPPDLAILGNRTIINTRNFWDRLRGAGLYVGPHTIGAEVNNATTLTSFNMNGISLGSDTSNTANYNGSDFVNYYFRRAPGFFDEVCYTGTGAARTVSHNLGVVPELMIVKSRSDAYLWAVYSAPTGNTVHLTLNSTATPQTVNWWNNTTPTASVFSLFASSPFELNRDVNGSGMTYVAYLFASLAGVSKVFNYTGNGSSQTINCGFTGGARFVMIKRTDSTGDWYVWDSARGIVSGNDPRLSLNTAVAEVTTDDSVDTDSTGFIVNQVAATNVNVNAATYIGLAIA